MADSAQAFCKYYNSGLSDPKWVIRLLMIVVSSHGTYLKRAWNGTRILVAIMDYIPPRVVFRNKVEQIISFFLGPFTILI